MSSILVKSKGFYCISEKVALSLAVYDCLVPIAGSATRQTVGLRHVLLLAKRRRDRVRQRSRAQR